MSSTGTPPSRNPRRRRRAEAEDGGSIRQQPQRKRTRLSTDVQQVLAETEASQEARHVNEASNHAREERSSLSRELVSRTKQHAVTQKRGQKDDGADILTKNSCYEVKQLPSLPQQLRSGTADYRGDILHDGNHALALTNSEALTWDYTSTSSTPTTRTFKLPHPTVDGQPLPLGSFVSTTQAQETGLVVVNPTSGRITYWESIENADALSLFEQRRNGIEGSCGNLTSGEIVTNMTSADHAGFVLTFSTGRVAQLLLRDAQARPLVRIAFLKTQQASGGILGGLKTVLGGGGFVRNAAAMRTRQAQDRGEIEAIVASRDAQIQLWRLGLNASPAPTVTYDAKHAISSAIAKATEFDESDLRGRHADVRLLDFALVETPSSTKTDLVSTKQGSGARDVHAFVLVNTIAEGYSKYALVELQIIDNQPQVNDMISLDSYTEPLFNKTIFQPRISISSSKAQAFVVFEKAIVIAALPTLHSTADHDQRMDDIESPSHRFQHAVYLREDDRFAVVGLSAETDDTRTTQCSLMLIIRGCGLVKVAVFDRTQESSKHTYLSIKEKLEQAIFYDTKAGTPLDLSRKSTLTSHVGDAEEAALEISHEICASESNFISDVALSMDFHMQQRATLLNDLAGLLTRTYPDLSRLTRWKLRWYGEKMAAARKVWSLYDDEVKSGNPDARLLPQLVEMMAENMKTTTETTRGERDQVRQWFLKDVWRLENLVLWAYRVVWDMKTNNDFEDLETYHGMLGDAIQIVIGALQTAFKFRTENADLYGLQEETMHDVNLERGYEGLPRFWTSTDILIDMLQEMMEETHKVLSEQPPEDNDVVQKISTDQARVVDLYCRCVEERYGVYSASDEQRARASAILVRKSQYKVRTRFIVNLAEIDRAVEGTELAEKYGDYQALAILVRLQMADAVSLHDKKNRVDRVHDIEERVAGYFKMYAAAWATPFFSDQIAHGDYGALLEQPASRQKHLQKYLRAENSRQKVSWIADVILDQDYMHASQTLAEVAEEQELDVWSKKVELSLAKLALAAGGLQEIGSTARDGLQLVSIQERLYEHMRPSLHGALDRAAEVQLAMERFGRIQVKGKVASQQLLERGLDSVIKHVTMDVEQLVDVLTLMDQRPCDVSAYNICGSEFILALQAVECSAKTRSNQSNEQLLKIIWRRCFIRDGWKVLDATARKSDQQATEDLEATTLFNTIYQGHAAGLWESNSMVRILDPEDVIGAGSTVEDLRERFADSTLAGPIAKDMSTEDGTLRNYISNCRLEHWVVTTKDWAQRKLQEDQAAKLEEEKQMEELIDDLQEEEDDTSSHVVPEGRLIDAAA